MRSEAGFSVAEFLVSMALTLVVLAIALTTFNDALSISETAAMVADTNENLRGGLNFLTRDLIQTGGSIPTGGIPIPSGGGAQPINRPSPPGQAYTFPATSTMAAVTPGAALGPTINGQATDMITVIYADITLPLNESPLVNVVPPGTKIEVDSGTPINNPDTGVRVGDLIMLSNYMGNAIQQVTSVSGQEIFFTGGDPMDLNQTGANQGSAAQLRVPGQPYPLTTATRILMVTYYLDATTEPGVPRLVRQVGWNQPMAIALGIENFQLTYNLVDGVTNPADVATPVNPNSPNQIRQVNISMMGRSEDRHRATRNFIRNTLTTQVSLRSLSFVNRYP